MAYFFLSFTVKGISRYIKKKLGYVALHLDGEWKGESSSNHHYMLSRGYRISISSQWFHSSSH